jgi:hypothetical protein
MRTWEFGEDIGTWTQNDVMPTYWGLARVGPMSRPGFQGVHTDIHGNHVVRGLWENDDRPLNLPSPSRIIKRKWPSCQVKNGPEYIEGFGVSTASYSHEEITKLVGLRLPSLLQGIALVKPDDQVFRLCS